MNEYYYKERTDMECTISGKNCKINNYLVKCKHCDQVLCSPCLIGHIESKMTGDMKPSNTIILPQKMDDVECVYCRKKYTKEYLYSIPELVDDLIILEQKLKYTMYVLEEEERTRRTNMLVDDLNNNHNIEMYNYDSGLVIINNKPVNFIELRKKVKKFEAGLDKIKRLTEEVVIVKRIIDICEEMLEIYAFIHYQTISDEYNLLHSDTNITVNNIKDVLKHPENTSINYTKTYIYNVKPSKDQMKNTAWLYPDYSIVDIKKHCGVSTPTATSSKVWGII
jgi:hypothetical protein